MSEADASISGYDMTRYRRLFIALLFLVSSYNGFADACFETPGQGNSAACHAYLQSIEQNVAALRSLGRQLEIENRYEQARDVYRQALQLHQSDRQLQQGLIRVRRELRAQALLAGFESPQQETTQTDCWTLRSTAAVVACAAEIEMKPGDWKLQERYGDVLRSAGRPHAAIQSYEVSLTINGSNTRLRDKQATLQELVDLAVADSTELYEHLPAPVSVTAESAVALQLPQEKPLLINPGRYRAVVIGNQNYKYFDDLESPVADAKAISELLRSAYGFEVTTVIDATRHELFDVLSELRRNSADYDNVLVYYAGHGFLDEVTKRGYWLPIDAEEDNVANWISTGDITNLVAGLESRHALVIADSCFSGALTRSASLDSLEGRNALLKRLSSHRSRMIFTSGGLEPVLDSGILNSDHSVFADALMRSLGANTGVVEAGRLFVKVRDRVAELSDQTPQYAPLRNAGHDGGDFIFVRQ